MWETCRTERFAPGKERQNHKLTGAGMPLVGQRHQGRGELADRLGVSERTLRRDIEQLRELGYHVTAERGYDGGYSLEAEGNLPPLLLDDDELVVLAVGLREVTARTAAHTTETALSALAKLEQLLPARLRRRVSALQSHTMPAVSDSAPSTAPDMIARLTLCSRDGERVRFGYTDATDTRTTYSVEPHCLISTEQGWYLVAWELNGESWEAFRINRIDSFVATGTRFEPRELDVRRAAEITDVATVRFARGHVGLLRLHAPMEELPARVGAWAQDARAESETTTLLPISADHLPHLIFGIAWIPDDYEFEIVEPPELAAFAHSLGARLLRADSSTQQR
ncbi:transcriptional regulator [Actinopolyspora erythraea]|uniref:Transcriptional regulator n=1 Tax=Actinopolyspora erythraea TaxID=414996 RepID=A0A096ZP47_9ACTN|nr:WYL domain-containing protein [Actinopolyspora erythraea]AIS23776.1 DeoR family transcriptional regulator [Actinopolyspora erythraea]ASU79071.1 transcriptional regulator [Actinopolyspora erythraea]